MNHQEASNLLLVKMDSAARVYSDVSTDDDITRRFHGKLQVVSHFHSLCLFPSVEWCSTLLLLLHADCYMST